MDSCDVNLEEVRVLDIGLIREYYNKYFSVAVYPVTGEVIIEVNKRFMDSKEVSVEVSAEDLWEGLKEVRGEALDVNGVKSLLRFGTHKVPITKEVNIS